MDGDQGCVIEGTFDATHGLNWKRCPLDATVTHPCFSRLLFRFRDSRTRGCDETDSSGMPNLGQVTTMSSSVTRPSVMRKDLTCGLSGSFSEIRT